MVFSYRVCTSEAIFIVINIEYLPYPFRQWPTFLSYGTARHLGECSGEKSLKVEEHSDRCKRHFLPVSLLLSAQLASLSASMVELMNVQSKCD